MHELLGLTRLPAGGLQAARVWYWFASGQTMAITTKRRRKIEVNGRSFVWWVAPDDDSPDVLLRICSTDKHFFLHFALRQQDDRRHVVVLGPEFPPVQDARGCWIRVRSPVWDDAIVTPSLVRRIIEWGLDPAKEVLRVNWLGLAQADHPP